VKEFAHETASRINRATFFTSLVAVALLTSSARCDVIMDWNAKADAIGIEKQLANVRMRADWRCSILRCLKRST